MWNTMWKKTQSLIVMLLFQNSGMLKGMMQKVKPFKSSAQVRNSTFDVCSQPRGQIIFI